MPRLLLMPNTLDLGCEPVPLDDVLPRGVIKQAAQLEHWIAEDAKSARAFLKRVHELEPLCTPLQALSIQVLPKPPKDGRAAPRVEPLLQALQQCQDMWLISEAGFPAVADPGSLVVAQAHRLGATVVPLSGPNSLVLALAASGLQGQSFAFVGYLPQDAGARAARLRELQARSQRENQTQLLIETPYRNEAVMAALLQHLAPGTRVSVACGLSLPQGWCRTLTVEQWRRQVPVFEKGLPAVFGFLA
ncbi:MAG: SAM-dependent methyltransferase [Betaproteobacteria bacterium]